MKLKATRLRISLKDLAQGYTRRMQVNVVMTCWARHVELSLQVRVHWSLSVYHKSPFSILFRIQIACHSCSSIPFIVVTTTFKDKWIWDSLLDHDIQCWWKRYWSSCCCLHNVSSYKYLVSSWMHSRNTFWASFPCHFINLSFSCFSESWLYILFYLLLLALISGQYFWRLSLQFRCCCLTWEILYGKMSRFRSSWADDYGKRHYHASCTVKQWSLSKEVAEEKH